VPPLSTFSQNSLREKKMSEETIVSIIYGNAVVPNFDSRGKPDLLAWDDAMDDHEDDEDKLAVFYNPDVLKACKPVIEEMYSDEKKLREKYESDNVDLEFRKKPPVRDEDKPTLKWFWDNVVGDFFDYSKWENEEGKILDHSGKEYDWEGGGFYNQYPPKEHYIIACMDCLKSDMAGCIEPYDVSDTVWDADFHMYAQNMVELGRKLYNFRY